MKIIKIGVKFSFAEELFNGFGRRPFFGHWKNNTGKTSILSVLDKFLNEKSKFSYDI